MPAPIRLLLATGNAHKTAELQAILGAGYAVEDLRAHPGIRPADETGSTFEENARLKALGAAAGFGGWVLADDSGLEVDLLGGAPGVCSARYAGVRATDGENRRKLLGALGALGEAEAAWSARFRCVLVLARGGEVVATASGAVEGRIVAEERGSGGFGYDPIFVPEGYGATFAELEAEVKNRLSHRARAAAEIARVLGALFAPAA
jgi:XTP/dITP diphosphohydrolase